VEHPGPERLGLRRAPLPSEVDVIDFGHGGPCRLAFAAMLRLDLRQPEGQADYKMTNGPTQISLLSDHLRFRS
jgi:hypothetical protein